MNGWQWMCLALSPLASVGAGVSLALAWQWWDERRPCRGRGRNRRVRAAETVAGRTTRGDVVVIPSTVIRRQAESDLRLRDVSAIGAAFRRAAREKRVESALAVQAYQYAVNAADRHLRGGNQDG